MEKFIIDYFWSLICKSTAMTKYFLFLFLTFSVAFSAQKNVIQSKKIAPKSTEKINADSDLAKINDSVAALIPYKKDGKFGFISQS